MATLIYAKTHLTRAEDACQEPLRCFARHVALSGSAQQARQDARVTLDSLTDGVKLVPVGRIPCTERHAAHEALERDDADRPHVRLRAGAGRLGDRRGVVLAQPEVEQLQVARGADHNVVGLHVAVHEAALVDGVEGLQELRHVEGRRALREAALPAQVEDEVASLQELHEHVDVVGVLECRIQLHTPSALGLGQDVPLRVDAVTVFLVIPGLVHLLQRVEPAGRAVLHEVHHAEGPLAQDLVRRKVIHAPCPALCGHAPVLLVDELLRCGLALVVGCARGTVLEQLVAGHAVLVLALYVVLPDLDCLLPLRELGRDAALPLLPLRLVLWPFALRR
eukprot:CAMPEP_0179212064 /NCGR_PEP_ID=MMETSP0797-20121207/873_1 /TAXON_ID=47934 /ORGANISM="Dinophysis acuminata, Strain DAEP01" /LENGTH=335 /DNA_ID=CAMNT_0020917585 /DNA_START=865 /DNA_END=1869 /DNA_ORIENTATION=+